MRIGFIDPHFANVVGGAEVNDRKLGEALRDLGNDVVYWAAVDPKANQALEQVSGAEILPVKMRYWYPWAQMAPGKLGGAGRHLFEWHFALRFRAQYKMCLHDVDLVLVTGRPFLSKLERLSPNTVVLQSVRGRFNRLYDALLSHADGLIFWGGCETQQSERILESRPYISLNAAIEEDLFYPGPASPQIREHLEGGIPGSIVVVYTGRLDPIQQLDQVADACAEVISKGFPVRLIFVGDGHARSYLEDYVSERIPAKHVDFLGRKPRRMVAEILRASDIFIMNPHVTSYSLSLKEALATGLFAIAPRTGTIAEQVAGNAEAFARIFPSNNPSELTKALLETLVCEDYRRNPTGQNLRVDSATWKGNAIEILRFAREIRSKRSI